MGKLFEEAIEAEVEKIKEKMSADFQRITDALLYGTEEEMEAALAEINGTDDAELRAEVEFFRRLFRFFGQSGKGLN